MARGASDMIVPYKLRQNRRWLNSVQQRRVYMLCTLQVFVCIILLPLIRFLRHRRKPDAAMYSLGDVSRRIPAADPVTGCISQSSHRRKSKPGMGVHHHNTSRRPWGFPMAMGMTSAMTSSLSFCSLFYRENFNGP